MKLMPFTKVYGGSLVLDFPGLSLQKGTVYAVIGANGSGKSTFAKILAGVVKPDRKGPCHDCQSVGYLPQKSYSFRMSTRANLLLNGGDEALAASRLEALGISHLAEKPAHRLSGGETARMALCRLTMKSYDLVILDEPTAAMDMEATALSEKLICDYVRETGCALILITHSLRQARQLGDRVLYFHKGQLAEWGDTEQVLSAPADARTKGFLEFYGV